MQPVRKGNVTNQPSDEAKPDHGDNLCSQNCHFFFCQLSYLIWSQEFLLWAQLLLVFQKRLDSRCFGLKPDGVRGLAGLGGLVEEVEENRVAGRGPCALVPVLLCISSGGQQQGGETPLSLLQVKSTTQPQQSHHQTPDKFFPPDSFLIRHSMCIHQPEMFLPLHSCNNNKENTFLV